MYWLVILTFLVGYLLIVFEHPLKLDKAIPALLMGIFIWTIMALIPLPLVENEIIGPSLAHHLGKITEILLFLLGAMAIVEVVDGHHGFAVITNLITTTNKVKLLWIISFLAFFYLPSWII